MIQLGFQACKARRVVEDTHCTLIMISFGEFLTRNKADQNSACGLILESPVPSRHREEVRSTLQSSGSLRDIQIDTYSAGALKI